jgi:hypothetical protein
VRINNCPKNIASFVKTCFFISKQKLFGIPKTRENSKKLKNGRRIKNASRGRYTGIGRISTLADHESCTQLRSTKTFHRYAD